MLVFYGFMDSGRSKEPDGKLSLGWSERIPDDASVVALFLDLPVNDSTIMSNLRIDLRKAFERGASVILCFGPEAAQGIAGGLVGWLQSKLQIVFSVGGPWAIRPAGSELSTYFREHLAHTFIEWQGEQRSDIQILGVAENDQGDPLGPCSVRFSFERAEVLLVPVGQRANATAAVDRFLKVVPPRDAYPEYLDALSIDDEVSVREQIETMKARLEEFETRLEQARQVKQILYFTEGSLEHEVVRFLNDELEVSARHMPGSDEDFRLAEIDSSEDWCIGEVKGPGRKNVSRGDVAALIFHRQQADLPEDFPGLLVANTFHRLRSVVERDQAVPEDVCRLAADNHVLIVRTLDLVRLRQATSLSREHFVQSIREGGGWFEVNSAHSHELHGRL